MADWRRSGPAVALGLFSIVPAPVVDAVDARLARQAVLALPWLGLVFGGVAAAAAWLVERLGGGTMLAVVVALVVLAGFTGAMHLDGLADTADGLGSRRPAEQAREVMRRSDIGPMGVVSLVLVLLVDAAALAAPSLGSCRWAVVAALPMVGRCGVVAATRRGLPGARTSGFGALVVGVLSAADVVVTLVAAVAACGALGWLVGTPRQAVGMTVAAIVALLVDSGWRRHLVRRLGGLTGDTFGSLVEVGQAAFVLACALTL